MKLNKERILDNFRAMIRIRTVSEESSADEQAFAAFRAFLRAEAMNWRRTVKDVELYVDVDALSLL